MVAECIYIVLAADTFSHFCFTPAVTALITAIFSLPSCPSTRVSSHQIRPPDYWIQPSFVAPLNALIYGIAGAIVLLCLSPD